MKTLFHISEGKIISKYLKHRGQKEYLEKHLIESDYNIDVLLLAISVYFRYWENKYIFEMSYYDNAYPHTDSYHGYKLKKEELEIIEIKDDD